MVVVQTENQNLQNINGGTVKVLRDFCETRPHIGPSQCDDLTRVVTESQRHIVADAVAGICFIEARQVTADVRQRR